MVCCQNGESGEDAPFGMIDDYVRGELCGLL